ncbi:MAG: F-type H+-transporting ATPase subunit delta [Frankiales bacterium]|nr:F-type H+-transporting ATPase subunit delta [Frankiales bacterium]MDX6208546.1 F-type H+-transporting ATPase subunit delta [Frankiales bacterium]MDX6213654.1 F-type H+-transporting ATPase subunit delta [Frankiales bacterium]
MQGESRASLAQAKDDLDTLIGQITADGHGGMSTAAVAELADQLFAVQHVLDREISLRRAFTDPSSNPAARAALARRLFGAQIGETAADVVANLVSAPWAAPRDIVDAVEQLAVQALYTVALAEGKLDDVEDELFRFGRIVDREPALLLALTDPAASTERRLALVDRLLAGKATDTTQRLVRELVASPRGQTFGVNLAEYVRLAAERRDRLVARVSVAVPLTEAQTARLAETLAAQLGRQVHLNVELDPELVGGMTVRIGDTVYDGSILRRLAEARRRLAG